MNYTYSLEKNSKKYNCPNCNKKRYVRFVNNETNELLDYNYGRCDRETSCGYFNKPTENCISPAPVFPKIIKNTISSIENSIATATLKNYNSNNLYLYLNNYFKKDLILNTFKKYNVGSSKKWNGATVFWQKDDQNNFRTGKIMLYDPNEGKRVKQPYNHISWAHKALKIDNFNLKQCLFGLHLVNKNTNKIGLVESEKTAITMDLFLPECLWISTGSKQNLKEELLNPIKDYQIILYPDKGEFEDWSIKCKKLSEKGFNISCSDLVEKSVLIQGSDLADIYFDLQNQNIKNIKLTETEKKVQKLHSINPNILNLINTFGLTDQSGNTIRTDLF